MRLYVAGPMRGMPLYNWPAFERAARALRLDGHVVISPTEIDEEEGFVDVWRNGHGEPTTVKVTGFYSYEAALQRDLEAVETCEGIVLLPGWEKSEGALTEYAHALKRGLLVFEGVDNVPPPGTVFYPDGSALRAVDGEMRVVDPATGGAKGSKPCQLGWVAPAGLKALGEVAGYGADKYAPTNYRRGYNWSLSINAAFRHLLAIISGEDYDTESGLPHAAHLAWHGCTLTQLLEDHPELDDRHGGPAEESVCGNQHSGSESADVSETAP